MYKYICVYKYVCVCVCIYIYMSGITLFGYIIAFLLSEYVH